MPDRLRRILRSLGGRLIAAGRRLEAWSWRGRYLADARVLVVDVVLPGDHLKWADLVAMPGEVLLQRFDELHVLDVAGRPVPGVKSLSLRIDELKAGAWGHVDLEILVGSDQPPVRTRLAKVPCLVRRVMTAHDLPGQIRQLPNGFMLTEEEFEKMCLGRGIPATG